MKRTLLFFLLSIFFVVSIFERYHPVSIDLVSPSVKQVEVKGEIMNPGVYTLKWEATVDDLIDMAGGISEQGDISGISLVRTLQDQEVIVIPKLQEEGKEFISINSATSDELQTIPGIGPSIAQRIIEYRTSNPFQSLEDIKNVKGIGDKMFNKMLPYICL